MKRIWILLAVTIFLFAISVTVGAATGTGGAAEPTSLPGQIVAFLSNETLATLFAAAIGLLYKFAPAFAKFSNDWIRVITVLAGWMVHVFTPPAALASPLTDLLGAAAAGTYPLVMGFVDSWLSHHLFEHWLRPPTSSWEKPVAQVPAFSGTPK